MLKVNIHNYEAYFLDYIEGNLSVADQKEVEKFLALYPDKYDELKEFEHITVPAEESFSFNKNVLKKNLSNVKAITDDNFDEFCIANLEGDLDEKSKEQFKIHLEEFPEKKKTEELFKKVYLVPDKKIRYPHKSKLKHFDRALFVRRLAFTGVAAASIGLLFTIQNPFNRNQDVQTTPVIVSDNVQVQNKETNTDTQIQEVVPVQEDEKEVTKKTKSVQKSTITSNEPVSNAIAANLVEESPQRQTILLKKIESSKVNLETVSSAASQLAFRNEVPNSQNESPVAEENKKVVTLTEYAFNEVKKVVPEGVQNLAEKKPALREVAENSKSEINELLSKQVTIEKEIDEEGKIRSFAVNTSLFAFYTTKVKK